MTNEKPKHSIRPQVKTSSKINVKQKDLSANEVENSESEKEQSEENSKEEEWKAKKKFRNLE